MQAAERLFFLLCFLGGRGAAARLQLWLRSEGDMARKTGTVRHRAGEKKELPVGAKSRALEVT